MNKLLLTLFLLIVPSIAFGQDSLVFNHIVAGNLEDAPIRIGIASGKNFGTATTFNIADSNLTTVLTERYLIKLPLDSILLLPANSRIDSAILQLTHLAAPANGGDSTITIYRLLRLFTEGTGNNADGIVSWDSASVAADNPSSIDSVWTNAGSDFDSLTTYGSKAPGSGASDGDAFRIDFKDLAEGWRNGTFANNGMMLKQTSRVVGVGHRESISFGTSDNATEADRPSIIIYYTLQDLVINSQSLFWNWQVTKE